MCHTEWPKFVQIEISCTFFPDHGVVLVVRVVSVSQSAIRCNFELHVLVTKASLVAHVIAAIEIVGHLQMLAKIMLQIQSAKGTRNVAAPWGISGMVEGSWTGLCSEKYHHPQDRTAQNGR